MKILDLLKKKPLLSFREMEGIIDELKGLKLGECLAYKSDDIFAVHFALSMIWL